MKDIAPTLNSIIKKEQCSPIMAFLLLEDKLDELPTVQSESIKKPSGGLCDKGSVPNH